MNIFKTFEIFLREPLSILRERFIQIVQVNSTLSTQSGISVDMLDKKTQITVYNSGMYNLLQTVLYKKEMEAQRTNSNQQKNQVVIGQLCGRK